MVIVIYLILFVNNFFTVVLKPDFWPFHPLIPDFFHGKTYGNRGKFLKELNYKIRKNDAFTAESDLCTLMQPAASFFGTLLQSACEIFFAFSGPAY